MEVKVYVQPKPTILDPQGQAVAGALRQLGFEVNDVRVGKEIIVDIATEDEEEALEMARSMCRKLLANPVIEDFSCQI